MTLETSARVVADSVADGHRLTTMEVTIHRFTLSEFNTHRKFCLAGDSVLTFDLPAGTNRSNGKQRRAHNMTIADFVDKWHNGAAPRKNGGRYRQGEGTNRQPMRNRLHSMAIRQINENTGLIQTSNVVDCFFSGEKRVYQVKAGNHLIAGSADHRIWTPDGYKTIGELNRGDEIVIQRFGKRDEDVVNNDFRKIDGRWRAVWQRRQRERLIGELGGCQKCGATESLVIHHIVEVRVDPSLAFDENNILLLCTNCHKKHHRTQGWQVGQYLYGDTVTVDRVGKCGVEPTFDLEIAGEFPNFIANGVVVHNSRNSASSRAIPVERQLERILQSPAFPISWPCEQPGMQGGTQLEGDDLTEARELFESVRNFTVEAVSNYVYAHPDKAHRLHKSVTNRLLEPFMWHTIVVSSTEWENFFGLRCSPLAQPEIRVVAEMMRDAYLSSVPAAVDYGEWHLPYITEDERHSSLSLLELQKISVARCARVSSLHAGDVGDYEKDYRLFDTLTSADPPHASPLEHVATPQSGETLGNFDGWRQLRHTIGE